MHKPKIHVRWEDDWTVGDHQKEYDCYEDGGPQTCERAIAYIRDDNDEMVVLAALGCIDDADDNYRQEIDKELQEEAQAELDKKGW